MARRVALRDSAINFPLGRQMVCIASAVAAEEGEREREAVGALQPVRLITERRSRSEGGTSVQCRRDESSSSSSLWQNISPFSSVTEARECGKDLPSPATAEIEASRQPPMPMSVPSTSPVLRHALFALSSSLLPRRHHREYVCVSTEPGSLPRRS